MELLSYAFDGGSAIAGRAAVVVGVVSSGNLEVLVEPADTAGCRIEVRTPARGFDAVWAAVLADFFRRSPVSAVRITINDVGATPAVVSLRLDQAIEEYRAGEAAPA